MMMQTINLRSLVASGQPRPLITEVVDKLAASIQEVGLIQPITVKPTTVVHGIAEAGWQIVAGHHRVAACRALGMQSIDAIVIDDAGHLQTELIEIDENLCRAELSTSQRTMYTKRRKQIWEALHPPEPKQRFDSVFDALGMEKQELEVAQAAPLQVSEHGGARPHSKGFAAATAAATGQSKATTNRAIARADALGEDTLTKVSGTSLDSGVELDALVKLPEPVRAVLVERASAGDQVSARAANILQQHYMQPPSGNNYLPEKSKIRQLAIAIKAALRGVIDDFGVMSVGELANSIKHEAANANDDDMELLKEIIQYLDVWRGSFDNITAGAKA